MICENCGNEIEEGKTHQTVEANLCYKYVGGLRVGFARRRLKEMYPKRTPFKEPIEKP